MYGVGDQHQRGGHKQYPETETSIVVIVLSMILVPAFEAFTVQ